MPEEQKSIAQVGSELWGLMRDYAKQETVDPLKGLGRFLWQGLVGAVASAIGIILLTLAALRVLQTHTDDRLSGNLSWIPYLIALVFLGLVIALCVRLIKKGPDR